MKVTIYELLGRVKDGKELPKKVEYAGLIYENKDGDLLNNLKCSLFEHNGNGCEDLLLMINDEVEILEEGEKKIPEKLSTWFSVETKQSKELNIEYANTNFENMYKKINEIIDYLKSKGE